MAAHNFLSSRFYLLSSTAVAALGGFLFGFDTAVISGTTEALQRVFGLSNSGLGFTVAIALIGTIIGSISVGKPSDRYGRRRVMMILGALFFVSGLGCAFSHNWYSFLFFRWVGGLGVGGAAVVCPMYIAELAPADKRGRLVAIQQLNIVLGILIAFLSNYLIAKFITQHAWRWMYGVEAIPAFAFMTLAVTIPNSPRWLAKYGSFKQARNVLERINTPDVEGELTAIRESLQTATVSMRRLFSGNYKIATLTAIAVAVFNQLSGINAILYYAPRIFQMTGLSTNAALLQSIGIGVINLIFTLVALAVIDKVGRKKLLLIGSVGMVVFLGLVAQAFYRQHFSGYGILIYLLGFIAFFAVSQGAVIWVYISEIFPNKVRAEGQSLGTFSNWTMNAIISWTFPVAIAAVGAGSSFTFFAVMMGVQFIIVWQWLPETKGKSLEQIQKDLNIN